MHRNIATIAAALLLVASATPALADDRPFVWTYWTDTPSQGERELEYRLKAKDASKFALSHQISLDVGLTDRWSLEPYLLLAQGTTTDVEGLKIESRYRFMDETDFLPAAVAYLEIERTTETELEGKLIVGKTLGPVLLSANLIAAKPLAFEPVELGYSAGAVIGLGDFLYIGGEARGQKLNLDTKAAQQAGPTVVVKTAGMSLGGSYLLGLSGAASQYQVTGSVEF